MTVVNLDFHKNRDLLVQLNDSRVLKEVR